MDGAPTEPRGRITTDGPWFRDAHGRTLLLRGVNLSGSTKLPYQPDGRTHLPNGFYDHRAVSFVGRPFPLDGADEHLGRLRRWGLTFIRLLTTWEAVEHAGPGEYDEEYLGYLRAVVERAAAHSIDVFIDPHQDVWSRWTGGDGAPGWTLEAAGFDLPRLAPTGAAITHQTHGDPFPRMIWPTNYTRLGCATLFTLFFGGDRYAPATRIDGVPAQEYLQGRFIAAMVRVAETLRGLPNVAGYDTLNEPGSGYIGIPDLAAHPPSALPRLGPSPAPHEGMLLGAGRPVEVGVWERRGPELVRSGTETLNPEGLRAWADGRADVWVENGVVGADGALLRPDHFAGADFAGEHLRPFMLRYAEAIRAVDPEALIFLEGTPGGAHPHWDAAAGDPGGVVNAGHWYDVATLFTKRYDPAVALDWASGAPVLGEEAVRRTYAAQLGAVREAGVREMGGAPTLIGEWGVPMDLDDGAAYASGDFSPQERALDAYADAMDEHLLSWTLWNLTPDNTNAHGDGWNGEDLSIYSPDQRTSPDDPDSGGRGLAGVVRPYARAVAGEPLLQRWDLESRTFTLQYRPDAAATAPSEVFVPRLQFPDEYEVEVSGAAARRDDERQLLLLDAAGGAGEVTVEIRRPPRE